MSVGPCVALCVTNDLVHDQRVHKMALTLLANGYRPHLVGRLRRGSLPMPVRPYAHTRLKLWFEKGKLFYLEYNLRLWWFLLWHGADIITANDLDTLPACYAAALGKRTPLVYDSHEYFTGAVELVARPVTRWLWRVAELVLLPLLPVRITVTESVRQAYQQDLPHTEWHLVRNLPQYSPPTEASALATPPVILYQGMLNEGRGLPWLIEALQWLPGWQVWIVGGGVMEEPLRQQAQELGVAARVRFWGMQAFEALQGITTQATVSVSIEDDRAPNNRYAAPNKLYDSIQARVPVVVTPLPEHSAIVRTWEVGEVMADFSAQALVQAVARLCEPTRYVTCQLNCHQAAQALCWEPQQAVILEAYTQAKPLI